jgi:hypothetical protein
MASPGAEFSASTRKPPRTQRSSIAQCTSPLYGKLPKDSLGVWNGAGFIILRVFSVRLLIQDESHLNDVARTQYRRVMLTRALRMSVPIQGRCF